MGSPLRKMFVQGSHETLVVMARDQVSEFVDDNVLDAFERLLGQLQIQPDAF